MTQQIESEIHNIFQNFKGKKTLLLIQAVGQEFMDDYIVCEETFTVTSLVAQYSNFNVPGSWECENYDAAMAKKAKLIYYRIYEKFMRNATPENLAALHKALGV